MKDLTAQQQDFLIEISNVGMSRAARQLSSLLAEDIDMTVPTVTVTTLDHLCQQAIISSSGRVACVYQSLSGCLSGKAMLLFAGGDSRTLINSILSSLPQAGSVPQEDFEHEAMVEIGNIIVSSSISTLADLVKKEVELSVPTYIELSADELAINMTIGEEGTSATSVIVLATQLSATRSCVSGTMLLTFSPDSMDRLINSLSPVADGE